MNIKEARDRFPQYADLSDEEFARGLHKRFYADMPFDEFAGKIGLQSGQQTAKLKSEMTHRQQEKPDSSFFALPRVLTNFSAETAAADPLVRLAVGAGRGTAESTKLFNRGIRDQQVNPVIGGFARILDALAERRTEPDSFVSDSFRRTAELAKAERGDQADITGLLGEVLNPVGLKATKMLPRAAELPGRIAQGGGIGGLYSVLTPDAEDEKFWENKGAKAGFGTTIGAGIPILTKLGGMGASAANKLMKYVLSPNRAKTIADDYISEIVGGPEVARKLAAEARKAKEIVPGSQPTTAEALAHLPEASPIIALQNKTASAPGGISAMFGAREAAQKEAREKALRSFAGTEDDLERAIAARTAASGPNYKEAFDQVVKRDPELKALWKDPFFKKEVGDAWELFRHSQPDRKLREGYTEFLHYVKHGLDQKLSRTGDSALNRAQRSAVNDVRTQLVDWLNKRNPSYDYAREQHRVASVPINQMQVGQELIRKLQSPTGAETPSSFLRTADDATKMIRSVTGMPRQSLGQVLTPEQEAATRSVALDLERKLASMKPAQATRLAHGVDIAAGQIDRLPSLLKTPFVVANWLIGKMAVKSEKAVDEIIAYRLLNPAEFAKAIEVLPPDRKAELVAKLANAGVDPVRQGLIAPAVSGLFGE